MFENTVLNSSDFDRSSGFGRYEVHGARTDLSAGSWCHQHQTQNGTSTSGGLAKGRTGPQVARRRSSQADSEIDRPLLD